MTEDKHFEMFGYLPSDKWNFKDYDDDWDDEEDERWDNEWENYWRRNGVCPNPFDDRI